MKSHGPVSRAVSTALLFLVLSAVIVVTAFLAYHTTLIGAVDTPSRSWHGAALQVVKGSGEKVGQAVRLQPREDAPLMAVLSPPFSLRAERYRFIRYEVDSMSPDVRMRLIWPTPGRRGSVYQIPLPQGGDGAHLFDLREVPAWQGTVNQIGLLLKGARDEAVVIRELGVEPMSPTALLSLVWSQWTEFEGWTGHSINFLYGGARDPLVSPVVATAVWVATGLLLYALWVVVAGLLGNPTFRPIPVAPTRNEAGGDPPARTAPSEGFGRPFDWRVVVTILLAGWLLLDARWQFDLFRQLGVTYEQFAGKPPREKKLAANDGPLYRFVARVKQIVDETPGRVFILTRQPAGSDEYLQLRAKYHLQPHKVSSYHDSLPEKGIQAGDYVLALSPRLHLRWRKLPEGLKPQPVPIDQGLLGKGAFVALYRIVEG